MIPATDTTGHQHTEVIIPAVAATCSEAGSTEGKYCCVCNEILLAPQPVDKLPHTEAVIPAVAATCSEAGFTEGMCCCVCNEILLAPQPVDKLPHTEAVIPAVAATCSEAGSTEGMRCCVCSEVLVVPQTIEKTAHTEVTVTGIEPTANTPGLTERKYCSVCGEITAAQEYRLGASSPVGYTITTEYTQIENERFIIKIPAGVYVPDTLEQDVHLLMDMMEQITGLSFYSDHAIAKGAAKVFIEVILDPYGQEYGNAWGEPRGVFVSPGDLLLQTGEMWTLAHELFHCLNFRNGSELCTAINEGFSTYWTQKAIEELVFPSSFDGYSNYSDATLQGLTPQNAEQLFLDVDEDGWFGYLYGFRLMHYLMEVEGFDRFMEFSQLLERISPYPSHAQMVPELKAFFGDDFFQAFGTWFVQNKNRFEPTKSSDLTAFDVVTPYPRYAAEDSYDFWNFTYQNRIIFDFTPGMEYAVQYRGEVLTGDLAVRLRTTGTASAYFFDAAGNLLHTVQLSDDAEDIVVPGATRIMIEGDGSPVIFVPSLTQIYQAD